MNYDQYRLLYMYIELYCIIYMYTVVFLKIDSSIEIECSASPPPFHDSSF